ncbi:MAG TPA: molybdenum ABC transporter ATP-binding protein [Longimicrobium sp.]|nr:molybdenum ABC transporter ATP-binding protein [Longimicrobium sp.]
MNGAPPLSVRVRLALDRFDLELDFTTTHRVTGVFGVSGSGKTALLETIAGVRRGARGVIRFGGETWLDSVAGVRVRPEARGVGWVPQESLLFPHLDVRGNLHAGSGRAMRAGGGFDAAFEAAVRVLELEPLLDRAVGALSGGERQRVALARALCSGPRLLLLDEPLAALDVALRRRVLPFLARVQAEFALPILLVSHDPVEVQALCEDLVVLRQGRIVARGEPRAVLARPDVFPLAEREGFQNVLPATVVEHRDGTTRVRLGDGCGGPALTVPRTAAGAGARVLVGVPADEVMLALEPPAGISARNAVPATVEAVHPAGGFHLVTARVAPDAPAIVAEVTSDALAELEIGPGTELYLLLKTSALSVYEDG